MTGETFSTGQLATRNVAGENDTRSDTHLRLSRIYDVSLAGALPPPSLSRCGGSELRTLRRHNAISISAAVASLVGTSPWIHHRRDRKRQTQSTAARLHRECVLGKDPNRFGEHTSSRGIAENRRVTIGDNARDVFYCERRLLTTLETQIGVVRQGFVVVGGDFSQL